MKKNNIFFILMLFLFGCGGGGVGEETSEKKEVSEFENVFELTKLKSVDFGLPVTQFRISYPNDILAIPAKTGVYNPNYIEFNYQKEDIFYESLAIGFYESATLASDFQNQSMLDQLLGQFNSQIPDIEVVFNGKTDFEGKNLFQLQLKFEISDEMYGSIGKYKMLIVLYPPDNDLKNGVLLIFQATESSDIKEFTDFGDKGKTGEIWKTFKFI